MLQEEIKDRVENGNAERNLIKNTNERSKYMTRLEKAKLENPCMTPEEIIEMECCNDFDCEMNCEKCWNKEAE